MNTSLETAWKRQEQWSATANELKKEYVGWRKVVFGLAIAASVAGALSVGTDWPAFSKGFAVIAALCAAVSPVISTKKVGKEQLQSWTRARSVSEALKASIYRYLVSRQSDRLTLLNDEQQEAIANVSDIVPTAGGETMPRRARSEDISVEDYVTLRVLEQANDYYFVQARKNSERAKALHKSYFALMMVAAGIAAVNGLFDLAIVGQWTAVFTTLGASVLAYLSASKYEDLSIAYQATGTELVNLVSRWEERSAAEQEDPAIIAEFVEACEAVISNQNQAWHAKLTEVKAPA